MKATQTDQPLSNFTPWPYTVSKTLSHSKSLQCFNLSYGSDQCLTKMSTETSFLKLADAKNRFKVFGKGQRRHQDSFIVPTAKNEGVQGVCVTKTD